MQLVNIEDLANPDIARATLSESADMAEGVGSSPIADISVHEVRHASGVVDPQVLVGHRKLDVHLKVHGRALVRNVCSGEQFYVYRTASGQVFRT